MGERQTLLPRGQQRAGLPQLLSFRAASVVLVLAACCLLGFELSSSSSEDVLMRRQIALAQVESAAGKDATVSVDSATGDDATGSEEDSTGDDSNSFMNSIPVINSIANMFKTDNTTEPGPEENAKRVKVELYMEALCPGCQYFTTHVLNPVMKEEGMADIIDLRIVPAGNAKFVADDKTKEEEIQCQHGPAECEGNRILACLSRDHGSDKQFMPSFNCIETHAATLDSPFSMLSNTTEEMIIRHNSGLCLKKHGIQFDPVKQCAESHEGEKLLENAVDTTKALKPKMEYAPWVLVDGKALKDDAYSLKSYICKAYKGVKPKECDSSLLKNYFPKKESLHTMTAKQARHAVDSYFDHLDERQKKAHARAIQRSMLHKVNAVKPGASQALKAVQEHPGFMFCAP